MYRRLPILPGGLQVRILLEELSCPRNQFSGNFFVSRGWGSGQAARMGYACEISPIHLPLHLARVSTQNAESDKRKHGSQAT